MTTLRSYIIGFVLSLVLTLVAFGLIAVFLEGLTPLLSRESVIALLITLALFQLLVQLYFFLHIGNKGWDLPLLIFAIFIIIFVVGGSLWIMTHLMHDNTIPFEGEISPQHEH